MDMRLPTRQEINPDGDLDGRVACRHFLGKNLKQAEALFREKPYQSGEDLMWMGPVAFRYYVQAAIALVRNEFEPSRVDIIPWFVSALEHRLEFEEQELRPVARQLGDVCSYILENYSVLGDLPPTEEGMRTLQAAVRQELTKLEGVLGRDAVKKDYVDLRPRLTILAETLLKLGAAD